MKNAILLRAAAISDACWIGGACFSPNSEIGFTKENKGNEAEEVCAIADLGSNGSRRRI
jgi:hypothetical protein